MTQISIWIPRPPDNANNRQHWAVAERQRKRYVDELDVRLNLRQFPQPPHKPFPYVSIASTWYVFGRHRSLDSDNATRRLKPVIDWLRRRGYFVDDSRLHCVVQTPVEVRDKPPHGVPLLSSVRLTLTPTVP